MNNQSLYIASAFSQGNLGGNKAGVYLNADALTREQKQTLAKQLNFSETVYILKPDKDADFKLEYFTPEEEVPLCGHATIATFTVLDRFGKIKNGIYRIQTKEAILQINVQDGVYFMQQNKPKFCEVLNKPDLVNCFDIDSISDTLPIQIVTTGLRDIMLPIKDEQTLNLMKPNLQEIARVSVKHDTIGIHAFTLNGERIICRNFGPAQGIDEESATGTSNCALSCYLFHHNIMKKSEYKCEQGYSLNQPSLVTVRLKTNGDTIENVSCGGTGYVIPNF